MAKYEYIFTGKLGDGGTQIGPRVIAVSANLETVRDREIPAMAKEADFRGAKFYMIQRLEDKAAVEEGEIP